MTEPQQQQMGQMPFEPLPRNGLSIVNEPPQILPGPQLLHELISWSSGDRLALECLGPEGFNGDQTFKYTYLEFRLCVESVLEKLHATLSASEDYLEGEQPVIPILVPQSPGLYISQLATLEVGAAFCPINLDAPKERVKFIVGDVKAKIIIATREVEETATWEGGPEVIYVEEYFSIPPTPSTSSSGPSPDCLKVVDDGASVAQRLSLRIAREHELAYIMYTSGSTGLPKGVGVPHLAAAQSLLAHDLIIPGFERFLQFAAPSFDVSVFEIFFPFFRGCTLVGVNRGRLLNDLPGAINRLETDGCELTPTVVNSLLGKRENVPGLRLLLTIGEMLTRPVVDEFGWRPEEKDDQGVVTHEARPGLLYGMYGPTEAAIHCTANLYMASGSKVGNIGRPFHTVSCFIAAIPEEGQTSGEIKILPLGEVGELILGGPQLAVGYLNRPKENAAAFMTYEGKPAYMTGDKGRMLGDGTIEVMGRISAGQVKLRGQRVELGEIEEVVYKQPGIKMAFALVVQGSLVVWASTKGEKVELRDLEDTCRKWLPKVGAPGVL